MTFKTRIKSISQSVPLAGAETLPAEVYQGAKIQLLEQTAIFESHWQYVGHVSQLPETGDLIVNEVANKPVLVVRQPDASLKAFYNVCQHRAGPLATEKGNVRNLRCRYHGWTYDLAGQLIVAPEMESTVGFKACDIKLQEVSLSQWQGFLFIAITESPPKLETVFSGIAKQIQPIDLTQLEYHHTDRYLVNCHWKVYMDNYLEGYHLPYVHPGLSKLLDYREYDTRLFDWYSYQFSPLGGDSNFYGEGQAHYYCVFPNLMLNILPNRCQVNLIVPRGDSQCEVIFDYYYANPDETNTQKLMADDLQFSDEIQNEDIDICERVQKGLMSGAYDKGKLCTKREQGVWHFQELVRQAYRQYLS